MSTQENQQQKFNGLIEDLIELCKSNIMQYAMESFMEVEDIELRKTMAMIITNASHQRAIQEMGEYFDTMKALVVWDTISDRPWISSVIPENK